MSNPALQPPPMARSVAALRDDPAGRDPYRGRMERTVSEDFRVERQDLKEAAEHSLNIIMDLGLDGSIRWISPSWSDVVGTPPESIRGKNIADILLEDKTAFEEAIESMRKDDSRSQIVRFVVPLGPNSSFRRKHAHSKEGPGEETPAPEEPVEDPTICLEGQGIMVYDRTSGGESHTMWMIRPYVIREVTIDLPSVLVESLGVGAEMLARYLTALAEVGANDPAQHPPPLPVLCRICERQITPWWFEKHTELCLQEHKAEMEVQLAHESLVEQRLCIVRVLDALETRSRQPRSTGEIAPALPAVLEYKGFPIGSASTPSSGPSSGRASPASPSRSRDRSSKGFGHHRGPSFAIRRPIARMVELVLDLCDTALEINTPALKETRGQPPGEFRTQSPQSESRSAQVLQWQSPGALTFEAEPGLAALCEDTSKLARAKVDAIFRHRKILEYSERIRIEFDLLVSECIDAAMEKARRLAAGEISDSSEEEEEGVADPIVNEADPPPEGRPPEEIFSCSPENLSPMAMALRNTSEASLVSRLNRPASSTATSTRSSSPRGIQTPRSHTDFSNSGPTNVVRPANRASIHFESDTGADSDSSVLSSAISLPRRVDSPGSELSLTRVTSSRDRKRRSLILPSVMSSRGQSPARSIPVPASPLRMPKPRLPSGVEMMESPITSPVLSTSEFSSPSIVAQHLYNHHHRRQSSTASSEVFRPPVSPRLAAVSSHPQPRAVPPSIKDFEIIKPISKGAFGSVYLSKKKSTGDYFAIKVLKKADMVAKNQVTNVKAERAIMMWQGESDFVAKLYWTFSSKDYLYLVMEYLNGGDCASLVKVLGGLPEDWAKKYLAEVVLGVEHLHSRGIVHRDLKPDNLLIDQNGHLKLTDFGLSRMGLVGRQKRALNNKTEPPVPDLLKQGPFHRAISVGSSRSASFDIQGGTSPSQTPSLTPAFQTDLGQPSYFSLNRESSKAGSRSDSENSDALQSMLRKLSIADESGNGSHSAIDEGSIHGDNHSPDPYLLHPVASNTSLMQISNTPPVTASGMLPPNLALFDPQDTTRKFVGTPDYLAPETINGVGQDEVSDWWSMGCILFEFLFGYPPFHADTPEEVFQRILAREIDWPPEEVCPVSDEAKDLMNRLMCLDPSNRLGANVGEQFASGGEEIKNHPWFADVNWETLREDEASFVPAPENPEDTEYFDARGATLQSFASEFEDQGTSSAGTPGADYPERPHDALSRVRSQVNSMKRTLMPLHIPAHVRDGRSRRLSEPVATDDFGNFAFKNLPVLEKANKDVIQKLRAETMQAQTKAVSTLTSPSMTSAPSLESSPIVPMQMPLPMPLKRTMSAASKNTRPSSPLLLTQTTSSPNRISQPSSPLLVQFTAGQREDRRKTSSGSSTLSHSSSSLQPGSFFDAPRLMSNMKTTSSSPIKLAKSPVGSASHHERSLSTQRPISNPAVAKVTSPRTRSHTVSSQESEDVVKNLVTDHHKRRSQVIEASPSSSDNEDPRQKALLRVQRRRQSSRRLSQITLLEGPMFRPLDVLVCEDHPVSRLVMEKLLEKLRCRTITAQTGPESMRYAMSEVKFDVIMMEYKLPQNNGADVARMIRDTKNANTRTPIVCVTGYLKELPPSHHFDGLIDKPPTIAKLTDILGRLCQWKPPPPNWTPQQYASLPLSGLRQESSRVEDSPISNSSSFGATVPSSSYRGSSRQDSIGSSFFGEGDSRADDAIVVIRQQAIDEWQEKDLIQGFDGLGISGSPGVEPEPKAVLTHQVSAPPVLEHPPSSPPRRRTPTERTSLKRRSLEKKPESAESGDDEDEELGNTHARTKSPKNGRPRGSSKLGTEMLRTNSHGSVVSVEDVPVRETLPPPPPAIAELPSAEQQLDESETKHGTLTPPELFAPSAQADATDGAEFDVATPKPPHAEESDTDPTPRPLFLSRGPSPATGSPPQKY
ncbi:hypothetical protein EJ06DRAFT_556811 [Trichodelitschia bisporula]|uniref:non-specific serine/threonine protein kinase n=1 Tax=Trichodelitschia bisporula TaxID=703511 RepID=A0A6G1HWX5_9PEZI|nr:hypothetical protein EJ06DRAFT_556811 [Trichodelitschia bisporula]